MKKSLLTFGIKTIISVNCIAAVVTLIFWVLVIFRLFMKSGNELSIDTASKASTLGFLVADLIWAVPILILSIPGLLRLNSWGWIATQMANILWVYSLTASWTRDIYIGIINPGNILFLPFAIFSIWSVYYLWINKGKFNIQ
jgi:hypothetical protein